MVKRIIRVKEEEIFQGGIRPPVNNYFFTRCLIFPSIGL